MTKIEKSGQKLTYLKIKQTKRESLFTKTFHSFLLSGNEQFLEKCKKRITKR